MSYLVLVGSCLLAMMIVIGNLRVIAKTHHRYLIAMATILLLFSLGRYMALIVYGDTPKVIWMQRLKYFYFASSLGVPLCTLFALWYIVPFYKEHIKIGMVPLIFLPWNLFYLYLCCLQPVKIVKDSCYGYRLQLPLSMLKYISWVQASMVLIILILGIIGLLSYKHLQLRVQIIFILAAQFLFVLDGLSTYFSWTTVFRPFTLTEAFAFAATYYAFLKPIKQHKPYKTSAD